MNDRFLRACRKQSVDETPIWLMRQAGRYMPEYRALRGKHAFLDLCLTPSLAVEVTLQPVRAFHLDAAILFSDLLVPLAPLGLRFRFAGDAGPVIDTPLRSLAEIDALRRFEPRDELKGVLEAVRVLRGELHVPLVGFAGAPFTLASYAVEGGRTRSFSAVKALMYENPAAWHRLASLLAETARSYLEAQVEAGAQAVQVFDTWIGVLDAGDFREFALPHLRTLFDGLSPLGVPRVYFGTETTHLLDTIREIGADVVGVDWRLPIDDAWGRLGPAHAVQGNLDPTLLLGSASRLLSRADDVLGRVAGRSGHVFNLGHGVLPGTPPDNVRLLVDHVHERSRR
ncbi:MAG: uroporphyrinogen decarboxylase [Vicinamibacteria bacterium]|nr:uroporphyrinogen decarboxylase [Vicinamibacteria bacterium]